MTIIASRSVSSSTAEPLQIFYMVFEARDESSELGICGYTSSALPARLQKTLGAGVHEQWAACEHRDSVTVQQKLAWIPDATLQRL